MSTNALWILVLPIAQEQNIVNILESLSFRKELIFKRYNIAATVALEGIYLFLFEMSHKNLVQGTLIYTSVEGICT
jgi:hypothetical protein